MRVLKRRKREYRTDYGKRIKLLKSKTPRVVFRKTDRYIVAQYVTSKEAQDKIEISLTSKKLLDYGWPKDFLGGLKNTSATYLTGFLMGKLVQGEKKKTPIIDFGMIRTLHKSKVFAFVKGLIDSGLEISCRKDAFPSQERIEGKGMKKQIPFSGILKKISDSSKLVKKDLDNIKIKSKMEKI